MDINFGQQGSQKNAQNNNQESALEEIAVLSKRIKLIENSLRGIKNSLENLENNFVTLNKDARRDIKSLEEENDELKNTIWNLKENMKKMSKDFQNVASQDDFKVMQKYLDFWNPVKFTTPQMVKRIVKDELESLNKDND
ncbi:MAG: hypothetical protein ACQER9_00710 [Nanobdellota archaeon]